MAWVIVEGAEEVAKRYGMRRAAVRPGVAWLHRNVMASAQRGFIAFSNGTVTIAAQRAYYKQYGVGMYGRGTAPAPDFIINAQPREDGSAAWLESFRDTEGASAGGGWISELHNDAMTDPYDASSMPLAKAFREGWQGERASMRPRPIAHEVAVGLRTVSIPEYGNTALKSIIAGRPL